MNATKSFTMTIEEASPSLNISTRQHWSNYFRLKKKWLQLIWVAKIEAGVHGMPMFERARVRVSRQGTKMLDEDNLVGGTKPLIDSLKSLGIIVDDSTDHIALTIDQSVGAPPHTVIHVERLGRVSDADIRRQFQEEVLDKLDGVLGMVLQIEKFGLGTCTNAHKEQVRRTVALIRKAIRRMDAAVMDRS